MLNEFRSTFITWDKATSRIYSPITANASDENGRKLVVQIVNSGQVEDLTGATLHLYWETRDKAHDGLDVFEAVDLKNGEFELSYTTGMLSNKGVLNANLVLIDTVGRVVSERFKITVTEGIDNDAIQSENSFSSLTQALIDISNLEQNYAPRLNDLTAQLQQTTDKVAISNDFVRFGKINIQSDFPEITKTLPFDLWRDVDGHIEHNFDISKLRDDSANFYLSASGVDTNDGLTTSTPVKTFSKALSLATASASTSPNIVFMSKFVNYWVFGDSEYTITKNINLMSNNLEGSYVFSGDAPISNIWTNQGNGVYSTPRTSAKYVLDYTFRDFRGKPTELKKVGTLGEVQSGTWFTDGSLVYVKRKDSSMPTDDIAIVLPVDFYVNFTIDNYRLTMDNVGFMMLNNKLTRDSLHIKGNQSSSLYINKPDLRFSKFNGLAVKDVGESYVFGYYANKNGYDGINWHGSGDEFVFEYEGYSHENGDIVNGTGNATTAHDGMTVVRVNCIGHDSKGPVLADVNGCYSLLYDCTMYDSTRSAGRTKAGFYFDEALATKQGKAVLINCGGGGKETYTVNSDGNVDIYVKNLKGDNIPIGLTLNRID